MSVLSVNKYVKRAVKGFIMNGHRVLLVRRSRSNRYPGVWEIPGGRLEDNETLEEGLKREILEEVGIVAEVKFPVKVHHFERSDNQEIHMVSFLCSASDHQVKLSEEHDDFVWATLEEARKRIHEKYKEDIDIISTWFRKRFGIKK